MYVLILSLIRWVNWMEIKDFLAKNPSVSEVLKFVESEAQRLASERKSQLPSLLQGTGGEING